MAIDLTQNHLALEPILLARLATVTGLAATGGAYEHDQMQRTGSPTPAAFVLYGGTATVTQPANGDRRPRVVDQIWTISLLVKPEPGESGSLHDAGELLAEIMATFEGYKPAGLIDPLEDITTDDPPTIYAGGLVHFLLHYRARLRLG